MPEFIIRAEETDLFFLFKDYKELIRCKGCAWYKPEDADGYGQCMSILGAYVTVSDEHYCGWGEKK